jgi:hypothetical protein
MKKKKNKNTNYYIDTAKYSTNVIETLVEKGGINTRNYDSNKIYSNCIYYIDPINKSIVCSIKEHIVSNLIKAFYTEIAPSRRLPKNTTYYYVFINITSAIFEIGQTTDNYTPFDDKLFESGNYFKVKNDAQEALNKIKDIFNNNKKY